MQRAAASEVLEESELDDLLRRAIDGTASRANRCAAAVALAQLARTLRLRDVEDPTPDTYGLWFAALGAAWEAADDADLARPLREAFSVAIRTPEFDPAAAAPALSEEVVMALCGRLETGVAEEKPFLRDTLYWVYSSFPERRPVLRQRLGAVLSRFARLPNRAAHVSEALQVLGQVIRGFRAPPLSAQHLGLLRGLLLPLHWPNEMLEWRDQIPLLETYHEALVYAVVQFLEKDRTLAPEVLEAVVAAWPEGFQSNTPKEVLLLHEVETILKFVDAPPTLPAAAPAETGAIAAAEAGAVTAATPDSATGSKPAEAAAAAAAATAKRLWACLSPKLLRCLSLDNSRVVEKALFMWKSDHFLRLVAPQAPKLMRPLMAALLRGGQPFWNPTVNKMAAHVLETLERMDPTAFRLAAEDLWGGGRTPPTAPTPEPPPLPAANAGQGGSLMPGRMRPRGPLSGGVAAAQRRPQAPPAAAAAADPSTPMTPAPWAGAAPVSLRSSMGQWRPGGGGNGSGAPPPSVVTGVAPWAFSGGSGGRGGSSGAKRASSDLRTGHLPGNRAAFPPLKRSLPPQQPAAAMAAKGAAEDGEEEAETGSSNGAAVAGKAAGAVDGAAAPFGAAATASDSTSASIRASARQKEVSAAGSDAAGGSGSTPIAAVAEAQETEEEEEAEEGVGLRRVHELMERLKPQDGGAGGGGGTGKWLEEQMDPTPTLLPSLRFHDLVFGQELGQGTFSVVRYARRITPGLTRSQWPEYAVKVVSAAKIRELRYARSVANEVAILRLLAHPSIARMVSAFRWRDGAYIVLEYASRGDLQAHVVAHGSLNEASARFVVGEVVAALCSVHAAGFVYGDLKPENVLLTESGHIKLADFGACRPATPAAEKHLKDSRDALQRLRDGDWRAAKGLPPAANDPGAAAFALKPGGPAGSAADGIQESWEEEEEEEDEEDGAGSGGGRRAEGTAAYLPPEVVRGSFPDMRADAWALGCLLYQCLSGRPPIYAETEEEVWARAVHFFGAPGSAAGAGPAGGSGAGPAGSSGGGGGTALSELPEDAPEAGCGLIAALTEHDPQRRLTVEAAAAHPFFAGADVFALHRGPAVVLAGGAVAPAPGAVWSRRQYSMTWAPMPQEFAFEQASSTLSAIEETALEAGVSFLPGLSGIAEVGGEEWRRGG